MISIFASSPGVKMVFKQPSVSSEMKLFLRALASITSHADGSHSIKIIFLAFWQTESPIVPAPAQMSSRIVFESTLRISPILFIN
jgi:hypothetical protein